MADGDETIENAAPAQAVMPAASPAAASSESLVDGAAPKRLLRRRVVPPDQTTLSSPAALATALVDAPVLGEPASKLADTSASPIDAPAAEQPGRSPKGSPRASVPAAKSLPITKPVATAGKTAAAKPVPGKPVPVKAAAKPVPAKPLPLKPAVAATKSASPAPAYPRSKVAPDQGPVSAPAPRATTPVSSAVPAIPPVSSIKDKIMDMSANFSSFQDAMSEAQAKAQAAFEKSSSALGEASEFAKGNVEAMIASSKILADGVQEIGGSMVAEGRTAFESMTADIKELAAAKSPTDFLKIQGDMVRKNFDSAVAYGSKNSETFLKLMSDAFAPLSGRVSLAVEKVRQTAPATAATI